MLNVLNLTKKYKDKIILNNINLSFEEAKIYVISGCNGCGKSTLFKILSGIINKTSGIIDNKNTIAYLPDKFNLPYFMTVKEYIKEVLKIYNRKDNVNDVLEAFNLENKLIGSLSKGNLQKLGLIFVLYNNVDYYILDEPIDGLDEYAKKRFKELINEKISLNKTVILSIHNKSFITDENVINYELKEGKMYEKRRKKNKLSFDL